MVFFTIRYTTNGKSSPEGEAVTVIVGPEKRKFSVHETLLRSNSAFFEAALKKDWKEGMHRTVTLPEEDADTFYIYVQWLYLEKFPRQPAAFQGYPILAKLYGLGETIIDTNLQDRVIDTRVQRKPQARVPDPVHCQDHLRVDNRRFPCSPIDGRYASGTWA